MVISVERQGHCRTNSLQGLHDTISNGTVLFNASGICTPDREQATQALYSPTLLKKLVSFLRETMSCVPREVLNMKTVFKLH